MSVPLHHTPPGAAAGAAEQAEALGVGGAHGGPGLRASAPCTSSPIPDGWRVCRGQGFLAEWRAGRTAWGQGVSCRVAVGHGAPSGAAVGRSRGRGRAAEALRGPARTRCSVSRRLPRQEGSRGSVRGRASGGCRRGRFQRSLGGSWRLSEKFKGSVMRATCGTG